MPVRCGRAPERRRRTAQTVYDSFGSKQALVSRLNDLIDAEAGIDAIVRASASAADPRVMAATSAKVTRSIIENCGDILYALTTGAAAEPDLMQVIEEGHRRHLAGARRVIAALDEMKALDESLDVDSAAETLAALTDFRYALMLRDSYGWSLDRIESWMADVARALHLGPA